MSLVLLGILNAQAAGAGGQAAYDLLDTQEISGTASSLTFSNLNTLAADYKHLKIRATVQSNRFSGDDPLSLTFNSDTSTSYSSHWLLGAGSSVASQGQNSRSYLYITSFATNYGSSTAYSAFEMDILDFQNTSKNTTVRYLQGFYSPATSNRNVVYGSGGYYQTSAITSMNFAFSLSGSSINGGSRFSLYGVR